LNTSSVAYSEFAIIERIFTDAIFILTLLNIIGVELFPFDVVKFLNTLSTRPGLFRKLSNDDGRVTVCFNEART